MKKDYTGGTNQYVKIETGMGKKMYRYLGRGKWLWQQANKIVATKIIQFKDIGDVIKDIAKKIKQKEKI